MPEAAINAAASRSHKAQSSCSFEDSSYARIQEANQLLGTPITQT